MQTEPHEHPPAFWKSPAGIALCIFGAVAAYFLLMEHREYLVAWLPYAFLAACPLMHVFMHHGHGGHGDHAGHGGPHHNTPPASGDKGPAP